MCECSCRMVQLPAAYGRMDGHQSSLCLVMPPAEVCAYLASIMGNITMPRSRIALRAFICGTDDSVWMGVKSSQRIELVFDLDTAAKHTGVS